MIGRVQLRNCGPCHIDKDVREKDTGSVETAVGVVALPWVAATLIGSIILRQICWHLVMERLKVEDYVSI